jgi:hypothetical protein
MKKGPQVPPAVAAVIIVALIVGVAAAGIYVYRQPVKVVPQEMTAFQMGGRSPEEFKKAAEKAGPAPKPTPEGLAQRYRNTAALLKWVAGLDQLQQDKAHAPSKEQARELLPILQHLQTAENFTEVDSSHALKKVNDILNETQKKKVEEVSKFPPLQDPSQPFASDEAKARIESVIKGLQATS